jgi:uncharacterized membrane protein YfcA
MSLDLPILQLALIGATAAMAGVVSAYAGFGGGLLLVPTLVWLVTLVDAAVMAAAASSISLLVLVPSAATSVTWREVAPMAIALSLSCLLCLTCLVSTDPVVIRRCMGAFVVATAVLLITGWRYRGPRGAVPSAITGALAGGVTGAFGIPGTPVNATYFLSAAVEPVRQCANIVTSNVALATAFLLGLVAAGAIDEALLWKTVLVVVCWTKASQCGKRHFEIAPVSWFRKVTLGLLLATGLSALLL